MKEIITRIIKVFFITYLIAIMIIAIDGFTSWNNKETKYAIVYWSKIEQNWKLSERLKARLNQAIKLFKNKKVEKIIVSWWIWETWFDESKIMRKYLIENWIKIPRILVDKNWYTTIKTWINSYKIIKNLWEFPNIWVVWITQFFHCSRVKLSLKKVGFSKVYCSSPDYFEIRDIYSILREVPAYIKYLFIWVERINISEKDLKKIQNKLFN
jgi:vancomycin permeability regulator SanA